MKKFNTILIALMLIVFCQCKPNEEEQTIYFNGHVSIDGSKTSIDGTGKISWEVGDKIYFGGYMVDAVPKWVCLNVTSTNENNATVSGQITTSKWPDPNDNSFTAYYFGKSDVGINTSDVWRAKQANVLFKTQSGRKEDVGYYHIAQGRLIDELGQISCTLTTKNAIARFDLSAFESNNISISYDGIYNKCIIDNQKKEDFLYSSDGDNITITSPSNDTYVSFLPADGTSKDLIVTFSDGTDVATVKFTKGIQPNTIYTANGNPIKVIPGAKTTIE